MTENAYLIVGGGSGIGLEITRRLVQRKADVTVWSKTAPNPNIPEAAAHAPLDVTTDDLPSEDLPDRLSGLVYCPGSIRLRPFQRLGTEDFLEDYQVNLIGAVRTIQACLPALRKAPSGASIVLFSTVAVRTGMPFHASIASAKGAVEGLTRSLAAEFAPRIRVNSIAPSLTDTPLAESLLADDAKRSAAAGRHPLKRIGTPNDIAGTALFLLEEDASWMTGQVLHVDGGMEAVRTFK